MKRRYETFRAIQKFGKECRYIHYFITPICTQISVRRLCKIYNTNKDN